MCIYTVILMNADASECQVQQVDKHTISAVIFSFFITNFASVICTRL